MSSTLAILFSSGCIACPSIGLPYQTLYLQCATACKPRDTSSIIPGRARKEQLVRTRATWKTTTPSPFASISARCCQGAGRVFGHPARSPGRFIQRHSLDWQNIPQVHRTPRPYWAERSRTGIELPDHVWKGPAALCCANLRPARGCQTHTRRVPVCPSQSGLRYHVEGDDRTAF